VTNVKYSGALTYPDPLGHLEGLLWVTFTFLQYITVHLLVCDNQCIKNTVCNVGKYDFRRRNVNICIFVKTYIRSLIYSNDAVSFCNKFCQTQLQISYEVKRQTITTQLYEKKSLLLICIATQPDAKV